MKLEPTGERYISDELWGCRSESEHRHRYQSIEEIIKGKKVLDVACGSGYGTFYISKFSQNVIGIDIDEKAIVFSKENYTSKNLEYKRMSAYKMEFEDDFFDVVVSFETIEHISQEEQVKFLKEIKRVLKKDGILIVSTPDRYVSTEIINNNKENIYHIHEFEGNEFKEFLGMFFSNINMFYQNIVEMSILSEENNVNGRYNVFTSKNFTSAKPSQIMVAICSNVDIKNINIRSIYIPNILQYYNETFRKVECGVLYQDLGRRFVEEDKLYEIIEFKNENFNIKFSLNSNDIKGLRFDPCEYPCKIKNLTIKSNINLKIVPENDTYSDKNENIFMHSDPIYIIKSNEDNYDICNVKEVEISGTIIKISDIELQNYYKERLNNEKIENNKIMKLLNDSSLEIERKNLELIQTEKHLDDIMNSKVWKILMLIRKFKKIFYK
ncbi:class I SAM-dependent methyltransferase [Clostridioides difficile]